MTKIAVYGTLKQGRGNNRLLGHSPLIGKGKTKDKYLMTNRGFPQVYEDNFTPETLKDKKTNVSVEVYEVDYRDLVSVDRLEGHPTWYQRKPIDIILDNGEEVTAEIYFMQENPNLRYSEILENGVY